MMMAHHNIRRPHLLVKRSLALRSLNLRSASTTSTGSTSAASKQQFCVLDLRNAGLSVMERLCLEECILRHDDRQWMIWGAHDPMKSRFLQIPNFPSYLQASKTKNKSNNTADSNSNVNPPIIVMGIGGKPELLLDIEKVKKDGVWVIKRFSGGGTVVVDKDCLYTTIIGRNDQLSQVSPYPREIMDWTATDVFGPTFQRMKEQATRKNGSVEYPEFALRENDYVLGDTHKVAGNAQSIVKSGFLHHTTFLWSYQPENMMYLTLPAKRPDYRKDRPHSSFLVQLQDAYHNQLEKDSFFENLAAVCSESYDIEIVALDDALKIVSNVVGEGGIQAFFETKARTGLLDMPP